MREVHTHRLRFAPLAELIYATRNQRPLSVQYNVEFNVFVELWRFDVPFAPPNLLILLESLGSNPTLSASFLSFLCSAYFLKGAQGAETPDRRKIIRTILPWAFAFDLTWRGCIRSLWSDVSLPQEPRCTLRSSPFAWSSDENEWRSLASLRLLVAARGPDLSRRSCASPSTTCPKKDTK